MSLFELFIDPVTRAPLIGSMLMTLASALMGVLIVVRRRSLLGETLSHAAYPGVQLSLFIGAVLVSPSHPLASLIVLAGAFVTSYLGLESVEILRRKFRVHLDAALCLVLSLFLGVGVVFASHLQFTQPLWYKQSQVFIYGQAATMGDRHILIYGVLALLVLVFIIVRFREIELVLFDRTYAYTQPLRQKGLNRTLFFLLILSIVVGIRSVGVILMSGMLLAPVAAARAFTDRFSALMTLSALFGMLSALGGNLLSITLSLQGTSFPTGPMILLVATLLTLLSLLFAPKKGAVSRMIRIHQFRRRCRAENILKTLWKNGAKHSLSHGGILNWNAMGKLALSRALFSLQREGWVVKTGEGKLLLTSDGEKRAARLVRLHRLWELYLASCLKADEERVHHSAEEMEHILTPELETRLSVLLNHPKKDPHEKPIPQGEGKC
ncbi:MAG: metal ABC transporter permease [Chlamydiia bacterium]|nr:metal ABC transporter permease [Chlamydiia bacterium]